MSALDRASSRRGRWPQLTSLPIKSLANTVAEVVGRICAIATYPVGQEVASTRSGTQRTKSAKERSVSNCQSAISSCNR
jgi:hypothetical protein